MKNFHLLLIIALSLQTITLSAQSNSKISYNFELGISLSDVNYGNEIPFEYLMNSDYDILGASSNPALGYNLKMGLLYQFNPKNELKVNVGYTLLGSEVFGSVENFKPIMPRPLSSEIPISVDGRVNFSFINFGGDLIHNFNKNNKNGVFLSAGLDYLKNVKTDWKVEVTYETGNKETQNNIPAFIEPDLNDLIMVNFRLGYNIILHNKYRIAPSIGLDTGLNKIHDDTVAPSYFSINLRFNPIK